MHIKFGAKIWKNILKGEFSEKPGDSLNGHKFRIMCDADCCCKFLDWMKRENDNKVLEFLRMLHWNSEITIAPDEGIDNLNIFEKVTQPSFRVTFV